MIRIALAIVSLICLALNPASAESRDFNVRGSDGMSYAISQTVSNDGMIVLVVNNPADTQEPGKKVLGSLVADLLAKECERQGGGTPSTKKVSAGTEEQVNRYKWKGQSRVAWTYVRYCAKGS